jgi:hypothetical protein
MEAMRLNQKNPSSYHKKRSSMGCNEMVQNQKLYLIDDIP